MANPTARFSISLPSLRHESRDSSASTWCPCELVTATNHLEMHGLTRSFQVLHLTILGKRHATSSVQPLSMKYQCISIELLLAIGVAGTAPGVQGVGA